MISFSESFFFFFALLLFFVVIFNMAFWASDVLDYLPWAKLGLFYKRARVCTIRDTGNAHQRRMDGFFVSTRRRISFASIFLLSNHSTASVECYIELLC